MKPAALLRLALVVASVGALLAPLPPAGRSPTPLSAASADAEVSRRSSLQGLAVAALANPAVAAAAAGGGGGSDELVGFEDGTLGLRFRYPGAWDCKGTGAFESLLFGRRVTTCAPRGNSGASVAVEARMVPAYNIYRGDLERAISVDEVVEMTGISNVEKTSLRDFGASKGYVIESSAGPRRRVDVFTVHSGDMGQFWAITLTASAPSAASWDAISAAVQGVVDSCAFFDPTAGLPK